MGGMAPPKTRAHHSKSRLGCRTCKIRRVKCDEGKPACQRCIATGRKCDGYEAPSTADWVVVTTNSPLVTAPTQLEFDDERSRASFDFFRSVSAVELSRWVNQPFWRRSLLQMGHQFPAIRHALAAAGSLHRSYKDAAGSAPSLISDPYATQEYGKALRELIKDLSYADKVQSYVVSSTCAALFITIELLQGNDLGALRHLDGCVKLLKERPAEALLSTNGVDEELIPLFAKFDLETSLFTAWQPSFSTRHPLLIPENFRDIHEAFNSFTRLMAEATEFKFTVCDEYRYRNVGNVPLEAFARQEELLEIFKRWKTVFDAMEPRSPQTETSQTMEDTTLRLALTMRYKMAFTMIHSYLQVEETAFDHFLPEFVDIVNLATVINGGADEPLPQERFFAMDSALIHPLYWTIMKCRDGVVRRQALDQLRRSPREGMWIPEMKARVAERFIQIEEEPLEECLGLPPLANFQEGSRIPEFRRIHSVDLFFKKSSRSIQMTYLRRMNGPDGEWDVETEWLTY